MNDIVAFGLNKNEDGTTHKDRGEIVSLVKLIRENSNRLNELLNQEK